MDENQNMNGSNDMNTAPQTEVSSEGSVGPVVATIIILLVIVLGGLYFWSVRNNKTEIDQSNGSSELNVSDEPDAIEADLESTNLDEIQFDLES